MSTRQRTVSRWTGPELVVRLLGLIGLVIATTTAASAQTPRAPNGHPERFGFGEPATADVIARIDIDVRPDGVGLPPGGATAREGAVTYAARCASCHGAAGEGGSATRLVGDASSGFPTVGGYWPYATTLFDYIRRAMPTDAPGSLTNDEVYGLTAWLLAESELISDDTAIDAETLPAVEMPARDRFVPDNRLESTTVR